MATADLKHHGGVDQAVYFYPVEHYQYWKMKLGIEDIPFGKFGENFTVSGMLEDQIFVGDIFEIGTVRLEITKPLLCQYK